MSGTENDIRHMSRAIQLAGRGRGSVEPNPMVGCVIVDASEEGVVIAEGWHERFGGPHAEIVALRAAGSRATGATMYVSLEPCCHRGKTPPCTDAVIGAGIRRVVVAQQDPFDQVAGLGIEQLRAAGLEVQVEVLEQQAKKLNAPYLKLVSTGRPWIVAKWAMTLDGKLATAAGHSQWISGELSRAAVHQLRGRVDAVLVGRGTAQIDDPLLTARPPGARTATRIVVDSRASLASDSRLVRTARDVPVLVAVSTDATVEDRQRLAAAGCEVMVCAGATHAHRLTHLLDQLGKRRMTNVLVEGGGCLLGGFWDENLIDEIHAFIAPKLVGGKRAPSPLDGVGLAQIPESSSLEDAITEQLGQDVHIHGRIVRSGRG